VATPDCLEVGELVVIVTSPHRCSCRSDPRPREDHCVGTQAPPMAKSGPSTAEYP
jgi:hypothetical protein